MAKNFDVTHIKIDNVETSDNSPIFFTNAYITDNLTSTSFQLSWTDDHSLLEYDNGGRNSIHLINNLGAYCNYSSGSTLNGSYNLVRIAASNNVTSFDVSLYNGTTLIKKLVGINSYGINADVLIDFSTGVIRTTNNGTQVTQDLPVISSVGGGYISVNITVPESTVNGFSTASSALTSLTTLLAVDKTENDKNVVKEIETRILNKEVISITDLFIQAVGYVDAGKAAESAVKLGCSYNDLITATVSKPVALRLLSIINQKQDIIKYQAELTFNYISEDMTKLNSFLEYLRINNIQYPDVSSYVNVLRNSQTVFKSASAYYLENIGNIGI